MDTKKSVAGSTFGGLDSIRKLVLLCSFRLRDKPEVTDVLTIKENGQMRLIKNSCISTSVVQICKSQGLNEEQSLLPTTQILHQIINT